MYTGGIGNGPLWHLMVSSRILIALAYKEDILLNMDRSVSGASYGSTPYQSPSSSSNLLVDLSYIKNMRFPVSIQENAYAIT